MPDPRTDSAGQPWAGRVLKPSPFSGDDGSADPALADAVARYARQEAGLEVVVTALAPARVLVPVLAEVEQTGAGEHGLAVDTAASAGVVALAAPDGRQALPVFSSVAALTAWRSDARPVPVEAARAALAAVAEQWSLLVLDPGGPVTVVIPRPAVWAIAQQKEWRPAVTRDGVDPQVAGAIVAALDDIPAVAQVCAEPGGQSEVAVVLALRPGLDRAGLDAAVQAVNARLAADPVVTDRVDSLELRITTAG